MDAFGTVVFVAVISFCIGSPISHYFKDERAFDEIVEQCTKQGYIQDKTTRIICSKENTK